MSYSSKYSQSYRSAPYERQPFHKPHTSLGHTTTGTAGHWIKTLGILSPVVIGEFVKDPEKRWKYVRLASVGTALLSEAFWTHKVHKEREEARDHELTCHSPG